MPEPVEQYDPDGVDYGWVMQITFLTTIVVGTPIVALLSTQAALPTWADRVQFAVGIGAVLWFIVAIVVFLIERRRVNDGA